VGIKDIAWVPLGGARNAVASTTKVNGASIKTRSPNIAIIAWLLLAGVSVFEAGDRA
jgi:hypothetical protein